MKDDTISKAAVLSALNGLTEIYINNLPPTIYKEDAIKAVKALPSATDTNVGGNLIDRGAAIDALNAMKICRPLDSDRYVISDCMNKIAALSSVQPEPLTDKEQRIFLAAMDREEKVCKQVDDERRDCREPYEDSLVRTCHEIVRKVKGALWT